MTDKSVENPSKDENQGDFINNIPDSYNKYIDSLEYLEEIEEKIFLSVTTKDKIESKSNAFHAWDIELNKIYPLLIKKLSSEAGEKLKAEERLWIKEKDKITEYFAEFGTSDSDVDYNKFLLTKQRTLELIYIYFSHNSDKNLFI